MLQHLDLYGNNIKTEIEKLVAEQSVLTSTSSFSRSPRQSPPLARRVELWDDIGAIPPALAARAAELALGDELLDRVLRRGCRTGPC
jgi:hypothetical protein